MNKELFIKQSHIKHMNKFDYSLVNFINKDTKVTIICPQKHIFIQSPRKHLSGQGCPQCCINRKVTHDEFIKRIKTIFGSQYDLSKLNFKNFQTKVTIGCQIHGFYDVNPNVLMRGGHCFKCALTYTSEEFIKLMYKNWGDEFDFSTVKYIDSNTPIEFKCKNGHILRRTPRNVSSSIKPVCDFCQNILIPINFDDFKEKAKRVHNNKYNYDNVLYVNFSTKINITCFNHGLFSQTPRSHLSGHGCPTCSGTKKINHHEFINRISNEYKKIYDLNKCIYINAKTPVIIICNKHGGFSKFAQQIYKGDGCPKCTLENLPAKRNFLAKAVLVHGQTLDFSKANYISAREKITVSCKKHGDFFITPNHILNGKGCPLCKASHGERKIMIFLKNQNIKYQREHTFPDCRNIKLLRFDFYLPEYQTCIEYDGFGHYTNHYGEKSLRKIQFNDKIKNKYCQDNLISLIRIRDINLVNSILTELLYPTVI